MHPTMSPSQAGVSPITAQPSLAVRKLNCSILEIPADPPTSPSHQHQCPPVTIPCPAKRAGGLLQKPSTLDIHPSGI